jgi:hypothetical protein
MEGASALDDYGEFLSYLLLEEKERLPALSNPIPILYTHPPYKSTLAIKMAR